MEVNATLNEAHNASKTQLNNQPTSLSRDLLIALLVFTNVISLVANATVILAIACIAKLRKSLSFVYIFSLCVLDLAAACTVVPKSLAIVVAGGWEWDVALCTVNGYFNAFLTFAVILTIGAIDLEKYYCIKYPMHHAGHMSLVTAVGSVAVAWIIALVLAAVPLAFTGGYVYHQLSIQCTFLWERKGHSVIYGGIVSVLCFLLPTILMLYVNYSMYRIAKRAMRQVQPISPAMTKLAKSQVRLSIIVTGAHGEPSRKISNSPEMTTSLTTTTALSRNNSAFVADGRLITDRSSINSNLHFNMHTEAISRIQMRQKFLPGKSRPNTPSPLDGSVRHHRLVRSNTNYKAMKNLVIPFLYFLFIWGSLFIAHFTWMIEVLPHVSIAETLCTLLVYVSYALNPFVYGFLNKTFRKECILTVQEKLCKTRDPQPLSPDPSPSGENFMDFLTRTSYPGPYLGQGQDQCQSQSQGQGNVSHTHGQTQGQLQATYQGQCQTQGHGQATHQGQGQTRQHGQTSEPAVLLIPCAEADKRPSLPAVE